MSPEHMVRRALVEACSRYDFAHSLRVIKQREYFRDILETCHSAQIISGSLRDDKLLRVIEMLPPMDDDNRLNSHDFRFMVPALVLLVNEHRWSHTGSCFKNSRATSSAGVCRYYIPRKQNPCTTFERHGVELRRKPAHEYINDFNAVLMATFKSNHDIQILLRGRDVANRIITAVNTLQKIRITSILLLRRREEKEYMQVHSGGSRSTPIQASRKSVAAPAYSLTNRQEMSGPMVVFYIERESCSYSNFRCENLKLNIVLAQLLGVEGCPCDLVETEDTNVLRHGRASEDINLFKFTMKCFRRKRTPATPEDVLFLHGHPLFDTCCLDIHSRDVVPVIHGPRMPYVDNNSPDDTRALRSKISLIRFKPFRSLRDLIHIANPTDFDWINAYKLWEAKRTTFDRKIMTNMDDYFVGTDENIDDDSDGSFDDSETLCQFQDTMCEDDMCNLGYETDGSDWFGYDGEHGPQETAQLNPVHYPSFRMASG
ncbi:hypothetical protein PHPALM_29315 [Phytophthora palmivora]|uniref:Uncharacterized protein n=1 Tax=Phytophthora palmivora TaxID=4796 RepID=A0A2P4X7W0_9STRA|nr:hypothetical protein PHPALM_29315 [Phytophthora palmivora]